MFVIKPRAHLEHLPRTPDDPESHLPYLRLDKNERIIPIPEPVLMRFHELLTPDAIMAYPELEPVYQRIASYIGVPRADLYLAAGSDLGIKTVYETYVQPGDRVVLHHPAYAMQEVYCHIFQANVTSIPHDEHLVLDHEAYLAAIMPGIRLVVLENPNGFLGTVPPLEFIRAVAAKAHRSGALLLLDEAYYLFSGQTAQSLYLEYDNVIISRTFSKDLGMAGLRCAYLLSRESNIQSLFRVKPMHEISSAAAAFTIASLEFPDSIRDYVAEIRSGLEYLNNALQTQGLSTIVGGGNFLLVHVGERALQGVIQNLKARKILVRRPFQAQFLRGWLRIGAGSVSQMETFVHAFEDALRVAGYTKENARKSFIGK
jgi:histidinol-phosphate aminotransferase